MGVTELSTDSFGSSMVWFGYLSMTTVPAAVQAKTREDGFCFALQGRQNLGILGQLKSVVKVLRHFTSQEMV